MAATRTAATQKGIAKARTKHAQVTKQAGAIGHIVRQVPAVAFRTDLVSPVLSFVVYGVPAPQGSKEFTGFRGGKPTMKDASDGLGPWRDAVRAMAHQAVRDWGTRTGRAWTALDEPVMVSAVVTMPGSTAAKTRGDVFAEGTPDLDKLQRAIGDSIAPRPLLPSDGAGMPAATKKKVREQMMAQRRTVAVLHDDSRIVVWDHCMKVYPETLPDSLGFSGVTIRVWKMNALMKVGRRPVVLRDGTPHMKAGDVRAWTRPLSGLTWDEEAAQAWQNPASVLDGPDEIVLAERGIDAAGIRAALKAMALYGPDQFVAVTAGR